MRCDRSLSVAWLASLLVATSIVAPRAMPLREQVWRLPFDHYHGLIFLTARINGSEPLAFAFDSGASLTTINASRAAALKLTLRDTRRVTGADGGEGSILVAFANGVALDVGDVRFAPDHVGVTSLAAADWSRSTINRRRCSRSSNSDNSSRRTTAKCSFMSNAANSSCSTGSE